jgi:predicted nucleic acid-binding protein
VIDGIDTSFLVQLEVSEALAHEDAVWFLDEAVIKGDDTLAIAPAVLEEFVHIVTDPKRFERPLAMGEALGRARFWWCAREVHRVFPTSESTDLAMRWMAVHGLGRKRILDTFLAATYVGAGIRRIVTTDVRDYSLFEGVEPIVPGGRRWR